MARHLGTLIIAASVAVGASVAQAQQPTAPAGAAPTRQIDCAAPGAPTGSTIGLAVEASSAAKIGVAPRIRAIVEALVFSSA